LKRPEYKRGYILDGFPRTLKQVYAFSNNVDKVIYLEISDKEALWRLVNRHQDRDDETLPAIKKRIEMFHKFTEPVIDHYRKEGKLVEVDGTKGIQEVNKEILESWENSLLKTSLLNGSRRKKVLLRLWDYLVQEKQRQHIFLLKRRFRLSHLEK
jgi:hypothetical protein